MKPDATGGWVDGSSCSFDKRWHPQVGQNPAFAAHVAPHFGHNRGMVHGSLHDGQGYVLPAMLSYSRSGTSSVAPQDSQLIFTTRSAACSPAVEFREPTGPCIPDGPCPVPLVSGSCASPKQYGHVMRRSRQACGALNDFAHFAHRILTVASELLIGGHPLAVPEMVPVGASMRKILRRTA